MKKEDMRKIMFSEEYGLEQAVLKNLKPDALTWEMKNMTRRVARPTKNKKLHKLYADFKKPGCSTCIDVSKPHPIHLIIDGDDIYKPEYEIGEEVAIAQRYKDIKWNPDFGIKERVEDVLRNSKGWTNKMFVCADFMPHRIRITGVHGERLQDISEEDCLREGIVKAAMLGDYLNGASQVDIKYYYTYKGVRVYFDTAREAFASLINGTSHKKIWEENPWVWVYEFVVI